MVSLGSYPEVKLVYPQHPAGGSSASVAQDRGEGLARTRAPLARPSRLTGLMRSPEQRVIGGPQSDPHP